MAEKLRHDTGTFHTRTVGPGIRPYTPAEEQIQALRSQVAQLQAELAERDRFQRELQETILVKQQKIIAAESARQEAVKELEKERNLSVNEMEHRDTAPHGKCKCHTCRAIRAESARADLQARLERAEGALGKSRELIAQIRKSAQENEDSWDFGYEVRGFLKQWAALGTGEQKA